MSTTITRQVLETARIFFEDRGAQGLEGTALLAGAPPVGITRCVIPDQIGHRTARGVAVEVTATGKLELASALGLHERWLARIHSHPNEAFHSETDDTNPVLTADGALSIVVPFFGLGLRRGLSACAVYVFRGRGWHEVASEHHDQYLKVVE